jgi:hypothetical protein
MTSPRAARCPRQRGSPPPAPHPCHLPPHPHPPPARHRPRHAGHDCSRRRQRRTAAARQRRHAPGRWVRPGRCGGGGGGCDALLRSAASAWCHKACGPAGSWALARYMKLSSSFGAPATVVHVCTSGGQSVAKHGWMRKEVELDNL